ncbi:hypothetical protein QRX50_08320 [Amycolatopsis carbonis]|uniref:DUF3558 domain-containing protein n=1 Tax=Amycolatopsis carbonis TaxID=715471 RepID=A0A9Y2MZ50_9PSEU|nr:hypothetical protein [Amycolatopsis sp. 2-15]WIX80754.1 hypothetical protein QRX50_08320 [Amycolatopsis sp. 2-15]
MRSRSLTVLPLLALTLAGCAVAPAPAPGKPAPALPAESVAYDQLPTETTRPNLFAGTCAQFEQHPDLVRTFAATDPPVNDSSTRSCIVPIADKGLIVLQQPKQEEGHDSPWVETWMGESGLVDHFRREVVLDRYYAVSTVRSNGCEITVNTGSPLPFTLSLGYQYRQSSDDSVAALRARADQYCPTVRKLVGDYLTVVDPGGGSLAR